MTVFDDDGKKVEDIQLYQLKTKEDMHGLMTEKGFSKKDVATITKERRIRQADQEIQQQAAQGTFYSTILQMYGAIGIVTVVFAFLVHRNSKNNTKNKKKPHQQLTGRGGVLSQV